MSEYIVDTFGIVQDFADLHGDMNTPLYQAIMDVMVSRQREEIVRCRDCRYLDAIRTSYSAEPDFQCMADWCQGVEGDSPFVEPDGFCAWGERRA